MAVIARGCYLGCQDPRLTKVHFKILESLGFQPEECDMILGGNVVLDLATAKPEIKTYLLGKIGISVEHHQAKTVIVTSHVDCGAYKLQGLTWETSKDEMAHLVDDMGSAQTLISECFGDEAVNFILVLIFPLENGGWGWETI